MKKELILIIIFFYPIILFGQKPAWERKSIKAFRTDEKIKIDGILNESIWQTEGYSEFRQSDPIDGAAPTEKTVVWVAYDNTSLYVAAYCYDSRPDLIDGKLCRRDVVIESDWFSLHIDPYLDRMSGFAFAVNPAGSFHEGVLYNDEYFDITWDCVWDRAVKITDTGWNLEMEIPFHQLRFQPKYDYTWGVDFLRIIHRKHEYLWSTWIPKEESGFVSKFDDLTGIKDIVPGRLFEVIPYLVTQSQFSPREEGNPFKKGSEYLLNLGSDIKVGLKSNLTLDLTVNPDFGQVELDPAVVNLTAFETFYEEKRPFFIEGATIFNFGQGGAKAFYSFGWPVSDFFYSRRIGQAPLRNISGDGYVKYPDRTTILGAAKITGKIGKGLNIVVLNALTSREYVEIDNEGSISKEEVEPLSNYSILRIQKEFKDARQGLGIIATSVTRDVKTLNLKESLNRNAYTFGVDGWTFLDKNKVWVLTGWFAGTKITGTKENILKTQKSSLHYFQRPDAGYLQLNENSTNLDGWGTRFTLNKQQGNVFFNAAVGVLSPGFNISNVGFQRGSSDIISWHLYTGYQWFHPDKVFRNKEVLFVAERRYDFDGTEHGEGYGLHLNCRFLNYWEQETALIYSGRFQDKIFTRGGPRALSLPFRMILTTIYSDRRKPLILSLFGHITNYETGSRFRNIDLSLRWKPKSNIEFSFGPNYLVNRCVAQYVTTVNDPLMTATYGKRYIYGEIDQKTISSTIRLDWTFTPNLTLQAYLQPFISNGKYYNFKEFIKPGGWEFNTYGESNSTINYENNKYTVAPDGQGSAESFSFDNPDFNLKSLRATVVLRWEYLPGSTLYVVWTQNRADYSNPGDFNFSRDFSDLFSAKGTNIFLIKMAHRMKF